MAQEHGVAGGATDHTQHGQPHVSQGLGGKPPVADTEHVGHRLGENNRSRQRSSKSKRNEMEKTEEVDLH